MMGYQELIDQAADQLRGIISRLGMPEVEFSVAPAKPGFGDLSCNAPFLLAARTGGAPHEISERLAREYRPGGLVARAEPHRSGYLNLFLDQPAVGAMTIRDSIRDDYGALSIGRGKTVTVEHTSVNPNKALHIGHIRNIVIGDTVARILRRAGFAVNVLNYVDDSGLQVADIVLGFEELGFSQDPPDGKKFDHYCGDDVYVKTTMRYEQDPGLEERRRDVLARLEDGSSETARLADRITRRVLRCQLETCWSLSTSYDCLNFESQIIRSGLWSDVFERLKRMGLVELEQEGKNSGCWVIRGRGDDDKVLVRSNGTATYIAKDIPYAAWKLGLLDDPFHYRRYGPQPGRTLWETSLSDTGEPGQDFSADRVITVIDSRQTRLQDIITGLMGRFASDNTAYVHLGYESVTLGPDTARTLGVDTHGRPAQMSGRRGLYVNADTVLEILRAKTATETRKRNPGLDDDSVGEISRRISVATIRYEMIKQDLDKIITFDISKSLSLEGNTAPYIQYTHARAARILEKAGEPDFDADYALLDGRHEQNLIRLAGMFDMHVRDAANNLSPKVIAKYSYDLAVAFNGFYEHVRILDPADARRANARLCLVRAFMSVLEKSLGLLGIDAPSRM